MAQHDLQSTYLTINTFNNILNTRRRDKFTKFLERSTKQNHGIIVHSICYSKNCNKNVFL